MSLMKCMGYKTTVITNREVTNEVPNKTKITF